MVVSLAVPAQALTTGEVSESMDAQERRAYVFGAGDMAAYLFGRLGDNPRADCIRSWLGSDWNYSQPQARLIETMAIDDEASRRATAAIDEQLAKLERERQTMLDGAVKLGDGRSPQPDHAAEGASPAPGTARQDDVDAVVLAFRANPALPAAAVLEVLMKRQCGEYR